MSCNCKNNADSNGQFNCLCDRFSFPPELRIDAGLNELPRQIAGFTAYRRAMLYAIGQKTPLQYWNARDADDLGMMLLEMWAYICDAVSFYDKVIAEETYIGTANLRPSIRRMVALLGYLPRPAIAATVQLTALADGRLPVNLPAGLAFRSGGFDGNPPQVFELENTTTIHPLTNRWAIRPPISDSIKLANPSCLLVQGLRVNIQAGSLLFLIDSTPGSNQNQTVRVQSVFPYSGSDRQNYTRLNFMINLKLAEGTKLNNLILMAPTQSAALWTATQTAISGDTIVLDNIYRQINPNDYLLIEKNATETRWYKLSSFTDVQRWPNSVNTNFEFNKVTFTMPQVSVLVTQLTLDVGINDSTRYVGSPVWNEDHKNKIKVHFGLIPAATIVNEPSSTLSLIDKKNVDGQLEQPIDGHRPNHFIFYDKNLKGYPLNGNLDYPNREIISEGSNQPWPSDLTIPVSAYGNVLLASRGEAVKNEILGSGNAAMINQTFKLKKKPLTYLFAPTVANGQGIQNTLSIYVGGIRWTEVNTFYGSNPSDEIYIVRQNDQGETQVTFGDGIRGRRLPSGIDNVVGHYRFGAGHVSPPAGSINQIAKPYAGLSSIENPIAASGGVDAEAESGLRLNAPKSALLLGRAISIKDMEAATLSVPGVRSVQSQWRWVTTQQRSMAVISFIGEPDMREKVLLNLRSLTDPSTPIQVEQATPVRVTLSLNIETDTRYIENNVLEEVRIKLLSASSGLLSPERIGIGRPLFRSRIFEAILSVPGTVSVKSIFWNALQFNQVAQRPQPGYYFNLELSLNSTPSYHPINKSPIHSKKVVPGSFAFFGKHSSQDR